MKYTIRTVAHNSTLFRGNLEDTVEKWMQLTEKYRAGKLKITDEKGKVCEIVDLETLSIRGEPEPEPSKDNDFKEWPWDVTDPDLPVG